ncbi:subunit of proteaseome activator complex [Carpediemonas membranifera]|uniref:Subunit of proteaseome activator complex n=1 Tax=Carpediemonas membranifera TaxID=201153 RepID=A0A8J6B5E8_9EUKA|nr:subunit of proteaseome activator complex [Carpediemonas membranifera]|eukprot:KAG9390402.1 subunit of proteaseome activator complex [Carpediemonas membranifera]
MPKEIDPTSSIKDKTIAKEAKALAEKLKSITGAYESQAEKSIFVHMPSKILLLHELLETHPLLHTSYPGQYRTEMMAKLSLSADETDATTLPSKRARVEIDDAPIDISDELKAKRNGILSRSNESFIELLAQMKAQVHDLLEIVGHAKMWIQLNIPRIEDGNNFGVSIQEETVAELSRAEDAVLGLLDGSFKFLVQRGRLVAKIIKHPEVEDYIRALVEMDEKELLNFRINYNDLKNNYQVLYDILLKNMDKIRKPRGTTSSDAYF